MAVVVSFLFIVSSLLLYDRVQQDQLDLQDRRVFGDLKVTLGPLDQQDVLESPENREIMELQEMLAFLDKLGHL